MTAKNLAKQGGSSTAQLDAWRNTTYRFEQAAIGQRSLRSWRTTKNMLKRLEWRINGRKLDDILAKEQEDLNKEAGSKK